MLKMFFLGIAFALPVLPLAGMDAVLKPAGRLAFVRNEKNAVLKVCVRKEGKGSGELELTGTVAGIPVERKIIRPASGEEQIVELPVETRLSVGKYPVLLTLKGEGEEKESLLATDIWIGPELHDRMPILIWHYYPFDHKPFQEIGFTHGIQNWWRQPAYRDRLIAEGFRGMDMFTAASVMKKDEWKRITSDGKIYPEGPLNASLPEALKEAYRLTFERAATLYREYPGIEGALVNTEIRDHTKVSFDKYSREQFQKHSGFAIPPEAKEKGGVQYTRLKTFPASRIIPDNDPILVFYRWFWKDGDGWNPMNSVMAQAYRDALKRPVWIFYDPAVRVPPIWGSGGNVDCLNHWVYATPDPINIGAVTSELQAMAAGNPKQKIMSMTQIIMYRSASAPMDRKVSDEPAWVKEFPKAPYITVAPDLLKIALWTQISRQVSGIMFHGQDSLFQSTHPNKTKDKGYQCTNPETAEALKEMLLTVVKPLGPVLKRIPERKNEVALLESFASAMFAGRSTWGWQGWPFELHLALLWGNLAPRVVYDETILRDKLDGVKVLILPSCDVLPEGVFRIIADFQRHGGIVAADENLAPALLPDITIPSYKRIGDPRKDKEALQKIGVELRDRLAPYYQPYVRTSDPDLVTWVRSSGEADYLFAVNDRRTFGKYIGPYGKVMEKSVDNSGVITIRRSDTGAVYDLVRHCEVPFEMKDGETVIRTVHDRNSIGKLFLLLPEKIGKVKLDMPTSAKKGETVQLNVSIETESGKLLKSIHPVQIDVLDSEGNATCDTTSAALEDGSYSQSLTIPLNAASGEWKIKVTDLASGKTAEKSLHIL